MPFVVDTLGLKTKKEALSHQLAQLEAAEKAFSRRKVIVVDDEPLPAPLPPPMADPASMPPAPAEMSAEPPSAPAEGADELPVEPPALQDAAELVVEEL